jgi:branched-chain amino acid transport system substrate-binding protein
MRQRLAALVAVALLAGGCGFDKGTIEAGGRVNGPNLTIYSSLPEPGRGVSRDMVDAEKLAIAQAGGKAGDFGINFVSIGEGPPDRDAPPKVAGLAASQVIRDPQVIAVIGTLRSNTALTAVPLFNAAGILQVSPGAGYPGFDSPVAPGEPEHWFPSGKQTFGRVVGNDEDQAKALLRSGKRVAVEAEAGKVPEALANAIRDADTGTLVDDPKRADAIVYAGTDVESAVGVAESLARENKHAKIVFPDELTRAGIARRLPRSVRRRALFATSAPERDPAFEAAFEQQFGRKPDPYAVLAYTAMQRVLRAIADAGPRARLRPVVAERYFALPPVSHRFRLVSSPASRRR